MSKINSEEQPVESLGEISIAIGSKIFIFYLFFFSPGDTYISYWVSAVLKWSVSLLLNNYFITKRINFECDLPS